MSDIDSMRLDPIYASPLASDAVITTEAGQEKTLRAIDKSTGISVPLGSSGNAGSVGEFTVSTIKLAACIRMTELAQNGLTLDDVDDGQILLNGRLWRIRGYVPRPGVMGEASGEALLFLTDERLGR